jgi:hypothetical protein
MLLEGYDNFHYGRAERAGRQLARRPGGRPPERSPGTARHQLTAVTAENEPGIAILPAHHREASDDHPRGRRLLAPSLHDDLRPPLTAIALGSDRRLSEGPGRSGSPLHQVRDQPGR